MSDLTGEPPAAADAKPRPMSTLPVGNAPVYSKRQLFAIRKSLGDIQKIRIPAPFCPNDQRSHRPNQRTNDNIQRGGMGMQRDGHAYVPSGNREYVPAADRYVPSGNRAASSAFDPANRTPSSAPTSASSSSAAPPASSLEGLTQKIGSLPRSSDNSKAQFMQQLVQNNSGASVGAFQAAIGAHKTENMEKEAEAAAKHEQNRLRDEQKKAARQENWKKKAAKADAERWGSVGKDRAGSLSFGQEERMKIQQSWRSDCAPTNRDTHPMDIDKMFSTDTDAGFTKLPFEEAVESTIVRGLVLEADAAKPEPAANTTPSSAKATKSRFGGFIEMSAEDDVRSVKNVGGGGGGGGAGGEGGAVFAPGGVFFASAIEADMPPMMKGAVTLDQVEGGGGGGKRGQNNGQKGKKGQPQQQGGRQQGGRQQQQPRQSKNNRQGGGGGASSATGGIPLPAAVQQPAAPQAMSANAFFAMIQSTQPAQVQAARGTPPLPAAQGGGQPLDRKSTSIDLATLFGGKVAAPAGGGNVGAKFNASIAEIFGPAR